MKPVLINGELWSIYRVSPGNPLLVDRTGEHRLATTDSITNTIFISDKVEPPLLDMVLLHEVAHAITVSYGLFPPLPPTMSEKLRIHAEEWAISLLEKHGLEAAIITSQALGRPLCISGFCI